MDRTSDFSTKALHGQVDEAWAQRLLRFWTRHGALSEEEGRRRLPEVVAALLHPAGDIAGVSSAFEATVPLVGGRRFWIYRSFVAPSAAANAADDLLRASYALLEEAFDPAGEGPRGLCVLLPPAAAAARPATVWDDLRMSYAGYLADGRQVRVAYFADGRVRLPEPVPDAGSIERFTEQHASEVLEFWRRERAMPEEVARRRVGQVHLLARDGEGALVGLTSAYLAHNDQLGLPLWNYRVFVGAAHRSLHAGVRLVLAGFEDLERRYVGGTDRRAAGVALVLENRALEQLDPALWRLGDLAFIGTNQRGEHVLVRYFPGATAPPPAQGST